jgi:hypothetical protein
MERGTVFVPPARTRVAIARSSSDQRQSRSEDDTGFGLLLDGVFVEYLATSVAIQLHARLQQLLFT